MSGREHLETSLKYWVTPDRVRLPVASEELRRFRHEILWSEREELVAFQQS